MSVPPPGPIGTIRRMGRVGKSCAAAAAAKRTPHAMKAKRRHALMGPHANLGHAGCESGGPRDRVRMDRRRRAGKADADIPSRRSRLDPAVARFSAEGGCGHGLPGVALRPLRLRPVGCARRAAPRRALHARRGARCAARAAPAPGHRRDDPGGTFRRRLDRSHPRRRRACGSRRCGDGAACLHRAGVPRFHPEGCGHF